MAEEERPVVQALDLLGRRWALRAVWELRRDALSYSELRDRLGVSPSVLAQRLTELTEAKVIERDAARRYRLSGSGRDLARVLYDLNRWAEQAAGTASAGNLET
jgi:DNA-binding HxlR family transcriptional regulator